MKTLLSICLFLATALAAACGDPPQTVESAGGTTADPHAGLDMGSDPHAGLDMNDPHAGLNLNDPHAGMNLNDPRANPHAGPGDPSAAEPFRVEGRLRIVAAADAPATAVCFLTIRGADGKMWMNQRISLASAEIDGEDRILAFAITEADNVMGAPKPEGDLTLEATYNPGGFVEDEEKRAAEPIPISDGDTGLALEIP